MTLINPQVLASLASLAVVAPPVLDGWLGSKVKSPALLAFLVLCVGVLGGTVAGLFTQLAAGSAFSDAASVFLTGTASGILTGLANWSKAAAAKRKAAGSDDRKLPPPPAVPSGLAGAALAFCLVVALSGCAAFAKSTVPSALTADFNCVEGEIAAGDTTLLTIEGKCLPGQFATVVDIVDLLVGDPASAASKPANASALKPQVTAAKASLVRAAAAQ